MKNQKVPIISRKMKNIFMSQIPIYITLAFIRHADRISVASINLLNCIRGVYIFTSF